jgi:large subunit ribosomal protein L28
MRIHMAKECAITKKSSLVGGKYANRTRATVFTPTGSVRRYANLQKKRVFVPELNKSVLITVSTKGLRTIQKNGAYASLKKAGVLK